MEDPTKNSQQILGYPRENLQQAINGTAEIKASADGHRASEVEKLGLILTFIICQSKEYLLQLLFMIALWKK